VIVIVVVIVVVVVVAVVVVVSIAVGMYTNKPLKPRATWPRPGEKGEGDSNYDMI
jgi:hypothetical protein